MSICVRVCVYVCGCAPAHWRVYLCQYVCVCVCVCQICVYVKYACVAVQAAYPHDFTNWDEEDEEDEEEFKRCVWGDGVMGVGG